MALITISNLGGQRMADLFRLATPHNVHNGIFAPDGIETPGPLIRRVRFGHQIASQTPSLKKAGSEIFREAHFHRQFLETKTQEFGEALKRPRVFNKRTFYRE